MEPVLVDVTPFVQDPTGRKGSISLKNAQERSGLLMRSINALREEGFATDFELRVENERIPVHRLVLAASSSYFKAMLGHDMKESNQGYADIKGLDVTSVKACIDYLYSGTIELYGMESVGQVLQACDLFQVNDLKKGIFKNLLSNIDSKSCLYVRKCALTYNAQQSVVQECDEFLATNLATVACGVEWGNLSTDEVSHCIRLSKDKNMSTLWTAIVNWVEKDRAARSEVLLDLLQLIIQLVVNNEEHTPIAVLPAPLGGTPYQQVHAVVRGKPTSGSITPFSPNAGTPQQRSQLIVHPNPSLHKVLDIVPRRRFADQPCVSSIGSRNVMPVSSNAGMLQRSSRFDFATIFTDILGHPLIAEREDCISFLLKTVIEPHIDDVARHVTVDNCFNLYSLSKRFQSDCLGAIVRSFMTQNFSALTNSERIKDLDDGDFTFLLKNAKNGAEEQKFHALATWTKDASRKGDFIELFSQIDLTRLSLDFIQNVVRKNRIVKESSQCNALIMDSFYNRAKSFETRSAAVALSTSQQACFASPKRTVLFQ